MWGDLTEPVHTHVVIQGQWFSWTRENIEYIPVARPKELSEFSTGNSLVESRSLNYITITNYGIRPGSNTYVTFNDIAYIR